jgi:hypothetical protein
VCGSERVTAVATIRQRHLRTLEPWRSYKLTVVLAVVKTQKNCWGSRVVQGVALQPFGSASTGKIVTLAVCQQYVNWQCVSTLYQTYLFLYCLLILLTLFSQCVEVSDIKSAYSNSRTSATWQLPRHIPWEKDLLTTVQTSLLILSLHVNHY